MKHSTNWLTSSRGEPSFNVSLMHSARTLWLSWPSQLTYISECFNVFVIMIQQLTLASVLCPVVLRNGHWASVLCRLGGRGTVHALACSRACSLYLMFTVHTSVECAVRMGCVACSGCCWGWELVDGSGCFWELDETAVCAALPRIMQTMRSRRPGTEKAKCPSIFLNQNQRTKTHQMPCKLLDKIYSSLAKEHP